MLGTMNDDLEGETWIGIASLPALTGRDRTTIFRARKSGRLTVWANEEGVEAVRLSDLGRLYPRENWPPGPADALERHVLAGRFRPLAAIEAPVLAWRREPPPGIGKPQTDAEQIEALADQIMARLIPEKAKSWRILAWAGAVSMLLLAVSNLMVVAALGRLAGLF